MDTKTTGTYLITGAGRGVGYNTVKHLLDNNTGLDIYAVSRNVTALEKIKTERLHIIQADVTTEIEKITVTIGKKTLNGIINNAGQLIKKEFTSFTQKDFDALYHTNVWAPFHLVQSLQGNLAPGAHIVNIGSMGGTENTVKFPGMILYSSSKAALQCLSQCLSVELKDRQVTVNCLSMGSVDTEMLREAFPGFTPPIQASQMAEFYAWFLLNGHKFFNGQILPLALTSP